MSTASGVVVAVHRDAEHRFSKQATPEIELLAGLGVVGDAHAGATVQHRSRVAADPTQPNLRQVHLISEELHHELAEAGFAVEPGDMGENITTHGVDLFAFVVNTLLCFSSGAVVRITGLRNPCKQLDAYMPGLMQACLRRDGTGGIELRGGVMGVVDVGGVIAPGDGFSVQLPEPPLQKMARV